MISASEVYWVMQADNFKDVLAVLGGVGIILSVMSYGMSFTEGVDEIKTKQIRPILKRLFFCSLFAITVSLFIPNSKTMAAMVILPTITSDKVIDTISPEAKEL